MNQPDSSTDKDSSHNKNSEGDEIKSDKTSASGFQVAASPYNSVKLELAIIIVLVILLWAILETATDSIFAQIGALLLYSCIAALWLVYRIRKLSRCVEQEQ